MQLTEIINIVQSIRVNDDCKIKLKDKTPNNNYSTATSPFSL